MKRLSLIVTVLLFTIIAFGQDANYKGPAKMEVTVFWRQMEFLKKGTGGPTQISNAEKALAGIKQKDAAYNTSGMEEELKKWKEALENKQTAKEGMANKEADATKARNQMLSAIATMNNDVTDCFHRSIPHKAKEIDDLKVKAKSILDRKDILAAYKDRHKDGYYKVLADEMKRGADIPLNREINNVVLEINDPGGSDGIDWEQPYYEIQGIKAYWEAAQQVFTEIPECADALKKCNELVGKYGTREQIQSISKANKVAAIKTRKLPAPVVKDAAMEKILIEGFNKKYGPAYNAKAIKAVLTQDGWTIERNAITGIVTGRNRTGKIAYKTEEGNGKCYLLSNNVFIYQAFVGNAFTNTEVIYNGLGGDEMLCENVK